MKGIILAGGAGTRLFPLTRVISKQLIPVNDKPMIYYPLSTLMSARIKDIAIISTTEHLPHFKKLLGSGEQYGIKLTYIEQKKPKGIAEAFILAEDFIGKQNVCLVLGDNIFYGLDLHEQIKEKKINKTKGATIFGYEVSDPERFGVIEFDKKNKPISIKEKPKNPKSNLAVVGLYFYDNNVVRYAKSLKPSARGELEITDINNIYISKKQLQSIKFGKGAAWLDTGTYQSLNEASNFINNIEKRQGIKVGCLEEVAFRNGWVSKKQIKLNAAELKNTEYGDYLDSIIANKK